MATATAPPPRSLTQRLGALERANEVRTAKAQLKRDLGAGVLDIHDVLAHPPDFLANAKVTEILLAVPSYGRVKVNKVLTQCRISPNKTVIGGLTQRQRDELVSLVRSRTPVTTDGVYELLRDEFPRGATRGQLTTRLPYSNVSYRLVELRKTGLVVHDKAEHVWRALPRTNARRGR
jgi:hypothetical protein